MRNCPRCNKPTRRFNASSTGAELFICTACGWTQDQSTLAPPEKPLPPVWVILCGWVFALMLVVGPYVCLLVAFPNMPAWVHGVYWLLMVAYLVFANTSEFDYDETNMGLFGTTINNPFTFEDDLNRMGFALSVLSVPGRIAWGTVECTWRLLRGRRGGASADES